MQSEKQPFKILYVEDEEAIRENYTLYLKKYFAHVYTAGDGEEAYKVYRDKKPELMLVDINIPKMNGLELVRKIRQNDRATKIIVLTAHADVNYLLDATELMLTKYLVKPITRSVLKDALNIAIEDMTNFNVSSNLIIPLKENFSFNIETRELFASGVKITLTNQEMQMLTLFLLNQNRTMSYEEIIYELWDEYSESKVSSIKTLIKKLRQKLPQGTIENVFAVGYKVNV
ncbi:MAG: response regulator transcription factor [Campylobacterales bacterium]|nr:response regulator transcription factor [Campylobacterales bacterium]